MLVFSTRIPIKKEVTQQECMELFVKWIKDSPHYDADGINVNLSTRENYDYQKGDITFSVRYFKDDQIELTACRLHNCKPDAIWDSDCIFLDDQGEKRLMIQLYCNRKDFHQDLPQVRKPYIVKLLVEKGFCDLDGAIPVTEEAIPAGEDNYDLYRDMMLGRFSCEMPVVYVSRDRNGGTVIDVKKLAFQLGGMAHVFVEQNQDISNRLCEDTDGNNAYLGYVGVYFPGTKYSQRHCLKDYGNHPDSMISGIVENVWDAIMNRMDATQYNWNQILSLQARAKMLEMKNSSEQKQEELQTFMDSFDSENKELKEKLEDAYRKCMAAASERDALKNAAEKASQGKLFYKTGAEPELYPGERNDLLYSVLSQAESRYGDQTRGQCLLRSLLDANPRTGSWETLKQGIEDALQSGEKPGKEILSKLERLGFTISGEKHYKLIFRDPRYTFAMAKTPSDYRGTKNMVSQICQKLDVEKKI